MHLLKGGNGFNMMNRNIGQLRLRHKLVKKGNLSGLTRSNHSVEG